MGCLHFHIDNLVWVGPAHVLRPLETDRDSAFAVVGLSAARGASVSPGGRLHHSAGSASIPLELEEGVFGFELSTSPSSLLFSACHSALAFSREGWSLPSPSFRLTIEARLVESSANALHRSRVIGPWMLPDRSTDLASIVRPFVTMAATAAMGWLSYSIASFMVFSLAFYAGADVGKTLGFRMVL